MNAKLHSKRLSNTIDPLVILQTNSTSGKKNSDGKVNIGKAVQASDLPTTFVYASKWHLAVLCSPSNPGTTGPGVIGYTTVANFLR